MADGGVRHAPYAAVYGLTVWAAQPGVWHELDGKYIGQGIDLGELPYDRFLNVIYVEMLARIDVKEKEDPVQKRKEFDQALGINRWKISEGQPEPEETIDPNAPLWWGGEEEASDSFLTAMGVNLDAERNR